MRVMVQGEIRPGKWLVGVLGSKGSGILVDDLRMMTLSHTMH